VTMPNESGAPRGPTPAAAGLRQARQNVAGRRPRIGPRLSRVNITTWRLVALAVFIAIWWLIAYAVGGNFLPTPWQTAVAAREIIADGTLLKATLQSLTVYLSGYGLAIAFAVPFGLFMGGFRVFGATMEIYVNGLTATPRVSFIPLIIVWLGLGIEAKVTIVWLGAVMPILINTYAGVLNVDGELIEMARSCGSSNMQIFRKIMLPSAMPYVIAGMRLGAAIGLINTVVAELYTALSGLGNLLTTYGNTFQMANYFVVVLMLAAIGVTVTQSLKICERRMEQWRYSGTEQA
jgi:ABC-type nitrate/sulfonate/bicarbonate transport system permease component